LPGAGVEGLAVADDPLISAATLVEASIGMLARIGDDFGRTA
jgi:hypothetical protein